MRAAVDEEGSEAVSEHRVRIVDGKLGEGQLLVSVVLVSVSVGAQRSVPLMTPLARST